jgi:hypothetical protein
MTVELEGGITRGVGGVEFCRLDTVIVKYDDVLFRRTQKDPLVTPVMEAGSTKLESALFVIL